MYIIECLPLIKTLSTESLSYFAKEAYEQGTLLRVTVRKKSVPAIVISSRKAIENKSEIRAADFMIKKIEAFGAKPFLSQRFVAGVHEASRYFALNPGALFSHLLPSTIIQNHKILKKLQAIDHKPVNEPHPAIEAIQTENDNRLSHYKALIRESFANRKSVFLCLSQNEEIRNAKENFLRGIESFVFAFHNELSNKELTNQLQRVLETEHPILIIATPSWLFLPRADIGVVIIEGENKPGWQTMFRPFIDLRTCTEIIGKNLGAKVIIGDTFLRIETLWRYKHQEIGEFESIKWHLPSHTKTNLLDSQKLTKGKDGFEPLSSEFLYHLKETVKRRGRAFVYAARKGLATTTVCRDCNTQVLCLNCESPMILHKKNESNVFRCHQCGEVRDAAELCKNCGGWNLTSLGLGVDRVVVEIKKHLPYAKVFELHKDVAPTNNKMQKILDNFLESRGAILVGTDMALPYLQKKVETGAIASIDSLFAIPDFRIKEKIFRLILEIKNLAKENFVMQSRNLMDKAVELATKGNLLDFYRAELEDRRSLLYPPFSVFIKITIRGTKHFVTREVEILRKTLLDWEPIIFSSIHEKRVAKTAVNMVIKVRSEDWPDEKLITILRALPPHFEIKVAPENLL